MHAVANIRSTHTGDANPVAVFWSRLHAAENPPQLPALMESALAALRVIRGVTAAAVAVDPKQVTVQVDGWNARRHWCLFGARDRAVASWCGPAGGWSALMPMVEDQGVWTQSPLGGQAQTAVAVHQDGRVVMVLVVAGEVGCCPKQLEGAVGQVAASIAAALSGAATSGGLLTEIERLAGENNALSRLNRLQGRFVAMASHDFKTPLTSITAYTDVLLGQVGNDQFPHSVEFLGVIRAEANRLLRMVDRILDFTRLEYGSKLMAFERVDLRELVQEAVLSLAATVAARNLHMTVEAPTSLPHVEVDADLIRQVIVNLLGNAAKFTPPGGHINIILAEQEASVSVSVQDDGPGIPTEDVRRIFREFYRGEVTSTKADGSGLGLSIARHIVQLHGGHIEARQRPQGGSEFRFMVPKETGSLAELPELMGLRVDPAMASQLISVTMRTIAELTGSMAVVILLCDGKGALIPVGAMGLDLESRKLLPVIENGSWRRFLSHGRAARDPEALERALNLGPKTAMKERLYCPLGRGEEVLGAVVVGRRADEGLYSDPELLQLEVLAQIVTTALRHLEGNDGRVIDALQVLLQIRRSGIPTSSPEALDLVFKMAGELALGEMDMRHLLYAATLHDAGMARVEDEIVLGAAPLSWDERDEVDRHVEQGSDLVAPLVHDPAVLRIIRHHHERVDGTGHPEGLRGGAIPLGARILAVVDAWFSLTKDRPYRRGLAPEAALFEIRSHTGTQFDPVVVDAFVRIAALQETP